MKALCHVPTQMCNTHVIEPAILRAAISGLQKNKKNLEIQYIRKWQLLKNARTFFLTNACTLAPKNVHINALHTISL